MANPENFVTRASLLPKRKSRIPILLQAIQMDNVKIKGVEPGGLSSMLIKHTKRNNRKSKLFLSKETPFKTKSSPQVDEPEISVQKYNITEKLSVLREAESKVALSRKHSENQITHGFRYHSNGDERMPRKSSDHLECSHSLKCIKNMFTRESQRSSREKHFISEYLLRTCSIPKLGVSQAEKVHMVLNDLQGWYRDGFRRKSEPDFRHFSWRSDQGMVNGNYTLHRSLMGLSANMNKKDNWVYNENSGPCFIKSDKFHGRDGINRSEISRKVAPFYRCTSLQPAKSPFNMRYGVSSKLLALRKPKLDDYKRQDQIELSKLQLDINEYTKSIQTLNLLKEKGAIKKKAVNGSKWFDN